MVNNVRCPPDRVKGRRGRCEAKAAQQDISREEWPSADRQFGNPCLYRVWRGLTGFSLDWRLGFPWFSLDSLVRNVTFQRLTGAQRRERFSRFSPPKLRQHRSVAMTRLQPVSTDGRLDPGSRSGALMKPTIACILIFRKRLLKRVAIHYELPEFPLRREFWRELPFSGLFRLSNAAVAPKCPLAWAL
jgi:hypothetical protein